MPSPSHRRTRTILTTIGALGLIGAGSATIIAGTGSGDREIRLASTIPDTAVTADAVTGAADPEGSAVPSSTTPSPARPASSAGVSAPASRPVSASPSRTTSRPSPSVATKRRTATPARTTTAPSGGGGSTPGSSTVAGEVLSLVNAERAKAGCAALTSESHLVAAAQKHTDLQADQNTMSHQLPGEASMGDRVTAAGYRWRSVGENVAAGYPSAASVMDGWMNSPGHKANILNCDFEEIGVGLATSSSGTRYWTQVFATPA